MYAEVDLAFIEFLAEFSINFKFCYITSFKVNKNLYCITIFYCFYIVACYLC